MQADSIVSLALIALAIPVLLVVLALTLARHRDGPVARWMQAHARALFVCTGGLYTILSVLRFLGVLPGSSLEGGIAIGAGVAMLLSAVLIRDPAIRAPREASPRRT